MSIPTNTNLGGNSYPLPNSDESVNVTIQGNKGDELIVISLRDKNDTLEQAIGMQMKDGEVVGFFVYSASNPLLSPPLDLSALGDKAFFSTDVVGHNSADVGKTLKSNPWFNVSFLAVFSNIMSKMIDLQKNTHYLEAQNEMGARKNILAIAKTQSELTKALYENRAEQKMIEAISSFSQAAMAGIQIGATWSNAGKARADVQKTVDNQKANVAKREQDEGIIGTNGADIKPPSAELIKERRLLDKMTNENGLWKNEQIQHKTTEYNRIGDLKNEVMKNSINGVIQLIQKSLIEEEGTMEAAKAMNDGYAQALNKYSDTSSKAADNAQAYFQSLLDFFIKIVDSDFRAHSIGQGA